MCGMAREFGDPVPLVDEMLEAADRSGMPVDARLWLAAPPRSSHPACLAVKAAAEQGDPGPYLRRLREGLMCRRRKLDSTDALLEEARVGAGVGPRQAPASRSGRTPSSRRSAPTSTAPPACRRSIRRRGPAGSSCPRSSSAALDGVVHGVYGYSDYASLAAAAIAAGARRAGRRGPAGG